jgi:flagellar biosynthesis protein FlhA
MKILGFDTAKLPIPTGQGAIPVFVLLILIMMLVPLPPMLLDLLFTFNIAVSIIVSFQPSTLKVLRILLLFPQFCFSRHYCDCP